MSPWRNRAALAADAVGARARGLRARAARAWAGARGRLPHHVVYLHPRGAASWRSDLAGAGTAAEFAGFEAWCAAHPGVDATLRVSGQWMHSLAADPALNLRDADAVRRYARQQFTYYHGPQAADWPLAVWADNGQSGACGLHGVDLGALLADACRHDVRLRGVEPVWSSGLAMLTAIQPDFVGEGRHALLLVEGVSATWLVAETGQVVSLRQRFIDAPRADAVASLLGALVLESPPLAAPPIVTGWGLDAPATLSCGNATAVGDLCGAGTMSQWMLGRKADKP